MLSSGRGPRPGRLCSAVAEGHLHLGNAAREIQSRPEERRSPRIAGRPGSSPTLPKPTSIWGLPFGTWSRTDEAVAACNRAIALQPDYAEAHLTLGNALRDRQSAEAMAAYHRAIALKPDYAEAHLNLDCPLWDLGRLTRRSPPITAIQFKPNFAEAHNNLGNFFRDQGRLDEALASYRIAIELKPDSPESSSNRLYALHFHPDFDAQAILAEHRQWAGRYAEHLAGKIGLSHNDPTPDRRLRVGFLSPDFRAHPVGRLLLPLFSNLDRRQTEIICYADVRGVDSVTLRLKALADRWYEATGLDDQRVADRIHDDRIDILVDLALHTANNRMLVFARKPVPVQVTMLGLPATTGLATMDYRLTDRYLDPPGVSDGDYSEHSIRLPNCFWCYQPPDVSPPVGELPAARNGFITFGCLNQFAKVSPLALRTWITILQVVPTARLLIQAQFGSHLEQTRTLFPNSGITGDRVLFSASLPLSQHFQRYHEIDICLDPFPYNGGTTTMDALWMGVPVIALAGRTAVGRAGVSILSNLGLPDLIAHTPEQYVEIAARWAADFAGLAELRVGLRERMLASVVMDGKQYAADIEAAFREMWKSWCNR